MRWIAAVLTICLWASTPAFSAVSSIVTHTFQSAAAATGNGTSLDVSKYNSLSVQVVISATATVTFEGTIDNSNWVSLACTSVANTSGTLVTSATASAVYQCNTAGLASVRMRVSAYTSGTVTVTGVLTTAVASKKGASGGGGSSSALLDGSVHTDTAAGTPVRGDVVCANSTPAWARLARGSTGQVLFTNASGDCEWGTVDAAPSNATFIMQTASSGTSAEQALSSLATGCMSVTTTTGVVASRTITGTSNEISVANGDCSAAPTISLPSTINLSSKTLRIPNSTSLPGTCTTGDLYMDTDATSGQRIYACQSANTWALQGDGGGGGTSYYTLSASTPVNNTNGQTWADSLSYYLGTGSWTNSGSASAATTGIVIPINSTMTAVCWKVRNNGTLASTEDVTHRVNKNAGGATTTGIALDWDNANRSGCETGLSFSVVQGDYVVAEVITPAWATDPGATNVTATMIFTIP